MACIFLLLLFLIGCGNAEVGELKEQYSLHLKDLANIGTYGYRSYFSEIGTQGTLIVTGRPLDLGVAMPGFFKFSTPEGRILFSRDGKMFLNPQGELINRDGYRLEPRVHIAANMEAGSIAVEKDGTLSYRLQPSGQLVTNQLMLFLPGEAGYLREGNYFSFEPVQAEARIMSGVLEESNVPPLPTFNRLLELLSYLRMKDARRESVYALKSQLIGELKNQYRAIAGRRALKLYEDSGGYEKEYQYFLFELEQYEPALVLR
ncbi:MAG: hypothetical protein B0D92_07435 [Spirochaeta sp. LUC14_002_19_P3]|nr:MAG: hypothetical protein B0D92_07435 [Spirochaeta sp. LUC14_002_19_P3]